VEKQGRYRGSSDRKKPGTGRQEPSISVSLSASWSVSAFKATSGFSQYHHRCMHQDVLWAFLCCQPPLCIRPPLKLTPHSYSLGKNSLCCSFTASLHLLRGPQGACHASTLLQAGRCPLVAWPMVTLDCPVIWVPSVNSLHPFLLLPPRALLCPPVHCQGP
jgi:hypothetical protein